jgi:cell division protein FtsB
VIGLFMDPALSLRSALPLLLVALLSGSLAWAFFGDRGVLANRALEGELLARQEIIDERQQTVSHIRREIERMKSDPHVQERWVRTELGYVRKGELIYLFPGDRSAEFDVLEDRQLRESELRGEER